MQNKPNVKYAQINVNSYMKSKYENLDTWLSGKNKANSNPIKANLQKAQMNVNSFITKDYRKKDNFAVRKNKPNSKPIQSQSKPIKPKTKPIQSQYKANTNPIQTQPVVSLSVEFVVFFP